MLYTCPIIKYRRYAKIARGKKLTLDEKIANVQAKIDDLTAKLSDAKDELKELQNQKEAQELEELRKLISSSGMSIEDVGKLVTEHKL